MDVSKKSPPILPKLEVHSATAPTEEPPLLNHLIRLTGLPEEAVHDELVQVIQGRGTPGEELTLEQLRAVMLDYLEAVGSQLESEGLTQEEPGADAAALSASAPETATQH